MIWLIACFVVSVVIHFLNDNAHHLLNLKMNMSVIIINKYIYFLKSHIGLLCASLYIFIRAFWVCFGPCYMTRFNKRSTWKFLVIKKYVHVYTTVLTYKWHVCIMFHVIVASAKSYKQYGSQSESKRTGWVSWDW